MLGGKKPDLSAQKAEAERQRLAEQDRIRKDKEKRLGARRGASSAGDVQSLVSFQASPSSGRSFFSGTGG